ncbi:MAG: fused MFS/spermidine synthase [Verrucomicrobiae bacterium]|nr:fused MFS/spermidine synthase [Verrucomicrobiae bacterium]NNJ42490.1 fused MFS/spermidine synthase [Akkermansiaceae bacterium]
MPAAQKPHRNTTRSAVNHKSTQVSGLAILALVFASGLAGLIYQILWMKQLGLLFGNTAQATSATLAAFFAGLGVGSWWWGKRVGSCARPLRLYAILEFGIAGSALIYFVILSLFANIYPWLYGWAGGTEWMLLLKFGLALLLVFPGAFFMGGTVPAIGQVMIRDRHRFGRIAATLYSVNTLGAAIGVLTAIFLCIPSLGYRMTCGLALLTSLTVGALAWKFSQTEPPQPEADPTKAPDDSPSQKLPLRQRLALGGLCFFSGFVVLALEVVWTRVFAQVHENSVYSFAITLVVVLVGLALGAGISSIISRFSQRPMQALGILAVVGGGLLAIGPTLLMHVTHDLEPVHSLDAWDQYVRASFKMVIGGIGYVVIALGTVFPFLMKIAEREAQAPGRTLGRLLAINTAGAISGSLLCGFVMLPLLGMWGSLQILSAIYLVVALMLPTGWSGIGVSCKVAASVLLLLVFTGLDPTDLRILSTPPNKKPVKVLQAWESHDCTVAVVKQPNGHRAIMINAGYALGSTSAYVEQVNQARIPLHLFPDTRSICFIGLGTGMSAGAALDKRFPKVDRVVTCELTEAVVKAAKEWIPPVMTGGVFKDPRSTILIEDGRHFLMATNQRFDMINADLFLPYRRGSGSLYSLDHYQIVAKKLNPNGVFVQWLPLYQITDYEFGVIVRTMQEAFGQVTMWRNNFGPGREKVALIGQLEATAMTIPPIGKGEVMRNAVEGLEWWQTTPDMVRVEPESIPFLYAGNLTAARALFDDYPLNTDDKPVIEFQTPKLFRQVASKDEVVWCVGPKLIAWIDRIFKASPLEQDPAWAKHPASSTHMVRAGAAFHQSMVGKAMGDQEVTESAWDDFKREWKLGTP